MSIVSLQNLRHRFVLNDSTRKREPTTFLQIFRIAVQQADADASPEPIDLGGEDSFSPEIYRRAGVGRRDENIVRRPGRDAVD